MNWRLHHSTPGGTPKTLNQGRNTAPGYDFWGGVGEPTICVVAPAIMNAIAAARGKPVRTLPLKHEGLRIV